MLRRIACQWWVPRTVRWALLRVSGLKLDTRAIAPGSVFTGPDVAVGRGSYVNTGCLFDSSAPISIGRRVQVGMGVMLITSTHELGDSQERAGELTARPITIGDGSWIGARASILPGVTVGSGCVVAAGAVVTKDCEPGKLYAGVPAKPVRDL
jgi:maltose O-acetyltransferase